MWYTVVGLVSSFMFSPITPGDTSFYTKGYIFSPPACEHKVVFPNFPQNIGILAKDETTYSAQLYLPNTFMRADCNKSVAPTVTQKSKWLELKMAQHINSLGGSALVILSYDITNNSAKFSAQLFLGHESILLNSALYLGDESLLTLTTIERNRVRSHNDANRFIASAFMLNDLYTQQ